jgi:excisionase family DNA binding protein
MRTINSKIPNDQFFNKAFYTRSEVAYYLSISISTVDVLIGQGEIRAVHRGRLRLIPREELVRVSKKDFPVRIWPEKGPNGKTRRKRTA